MSYTVPSPAAESRQRPATVSLAVWLLYLVAALWLLSGVLAVAIVGDLRTVFERAFADDPQLGADGANAAATVATAVSVLTALVFTIGLVVLAVLNSRGNNVGRIITWVVAGLGACCAGSGLLSAVAGGAMTGFSPGGGGVDADELERLMTELLPSWYEPVSIVISALQLLGLLAAIVLLALPASNPFFKRQPPPWEPPVPAYPPVQPPPAG